MTLIAKAIYEREVLKLLEDIDLEDDEEVVVIVRKKPNIDKFVGILGKALAKELEAYEEEVYSS